MMGFAILWIEEFNSLPFRKFREERRNYAERHYRKETGRLAPVVTAVLYWGTEEWNRPKSLHDMLVFPAETEEKIKPYVADYPMNLIPLAKLSEKVRGRLKSDFRLIAEYVASRKDTEELQKVMRDCSQKIRHPEEFLDALSEVAGDKRFKEIKEQMSEEKKEEGVYMCTILDEYGEEKRQEGKLEGKTDHLIDLICKKLRKGKSQEVIAEEVEESLEQIQKICGVAAAFAPEYESAKVYEAWKVRE